MMTYPAGEVNMEKPVRAANIVCQAVRSLREKLGDTQQQFATRLNMAISTVVRYELTRAPQGEVLVKFMNLAAGNGADELAEVFRGALSEQLGYQVPLAPILGEYVSYPPAPDERREIEYLRNILRSANLGSGVGKEIRDQWFRLRQPVADRMAKGDLFLLACEGIIETVQERVMNGAPDEAIISEFKSSDHRELANMILQSMRKPGFKPIPPELKKQIAQLRSEQEKQ
jgi:transcriptional regulator with XRE-family HTH domain